MASPMTDKDDADRVDGTSAAAAAAGFDFVRFTMSDIHGIARSKLIARSHVDEKLKAGISVCSGELSSVVLFV